MSARDDVLQRIRTANRVAGVGAAPDIPRGYASGGAFSAGSPEVLDLLEDRLLDYKASVTRCPVGGIPGAVHDALAAALAATSTDAPSRVMVPPGLPRDWVTGDGFEVVVDDGALTPAELDRAAAVVTGASAAAAVTGTIVLDGSPDQGRRMLSLVPDVHVCVVHARQVVHSVPELLARLEPTRPMTFISGPSATSDIELERVEGVHGPRTLHVVVVDPAAADSAMGRSSDADPTGVTG